MLTAITDWSRYVHAITAIWQGSSVVKAWQHTVTAASVLLDMTMCTVQAIYWAVQHRIFHLRYPFRKAHVLLKRKLRPNNRSGLAGQNSQWICVWSTANKGFETQAATAHALFGQPCHRLA